MGGAFEMWRRYEKCIQGFCRKTWREETAWRRKCEWEDIIKMDYKVTGCADLDWIHSAQVKIHRRGMVVITFRTPWKEVNYFTNRMNNYNNLKDRAAWSNEEGINMNI